MHPWHHAVSSAEKWGGKPDEYLPIHDWFDQSKMTMADVRHRALRHHAEGCFACEERFGTTLTLSNGTVVPVRLIAERHIKEDLGFVPSAEAWLKHIQMEDWMLGKPREIRKGVF